MSFEAIKQCAIRQDAEALAQIPNPAQPTGFWSLFAARVYQTSIDVRKKGFPYLTPAGELALEGNDAGVAFLKQHGASVNSIALGFALGGHVAQAANASFNSIHTKNQCKPLDYHSVLW
jgi:hypothetical protein